MHTLTEMIDFEQICLCGSFALCFYHWVFFFFVKLALTAANPVDILAHRFTVAFLAALFPLLLGWVKIGISMKDALKVLPLALFYPVMFFAFQVFGLVYTSSSEAGIIQAAIPIFTMIFAAYFLNERFTKRQFFSPSCQRRGWPASL